MGRRSDGAAAAAPTSPIGSSNDSSANIPPTARAGGWRVAKDRSTAACSKVPVRAADAAAGTTTLVPHLGQGRLVPVQRPGTWSRARHPVQRKPIDMVACSLNGRQARDAGVKKVRAATALGGLRHHRSRGQLRDRMDGLDDLQASRASRERSSGRFPPTRQPTQPRVPRRTLDRSRPPSHRRAMPGGHPARTPRPGQPAGAPCRPNTRQANGGPHHAWEGVLGLEAVSGADAFRGPQRAGRPPGWHVKG